MRQLYKSVLTLGITVLWIFANVAAAQQPASTKAPAQEGRKAPAVTQAKKPAPKPAPLEVPLIRFEKYKLDNGLEVIL